MIKVYIIKNKLYFVTKVFVNYRLAINTQNSSYYSLFYAWLWMKHGLSNFKETGVTLSIIGHNKIGEPTFILRRK